MNRLKELQEAKVAAQHVLLRMDNAIKSLENAKSWGWWDMFGGGMLTSMFKRDNIRHANEDIREISQALHRLNQELEDVNMTLPLEINDTISDTVFDVWFDNIFTDWHVQDEVSKKLVEIKQFRSELGALIERLDREIHYFK